MLLAKASRISWCGETTGFFSDLQNRAHTAQFKKTKTQTNKQPPLRISPELS